MILEGIVTTLDAQGAVNVSPMGPLVDESMQSLRLRPYQTSRTYANLKRTGQGIFHVVDDVELLARAAIDRFDEPPETMPCEEVDGAILTAACRWYAFYVDWLDDSQQRTDVRCRVFATGRLKDFFGLNRAKYAVVEAAILATRVGILAEAEIREALPRLQPLIEKTGGTAERRAFDLLTDYIEEKLRAGKSRPEA